MSLRRTLTAAAVSLGMLTLAACGYGSEAKDDDSVKVAAGAKKIDGLGSVRIGYFGNLTHGTALVGNQNVIEISSNQERISVTAPFPISANKWYTLKTRVDLPPLRLPGERGYA